MHKFSMDKRTYWKCPHAYDVKTETVYTGEGSPKLKKKKMDKYTVERKFLAKYSVEEMLVRIIKSRVRSKGRGEK